MADPTPLSLQQQHALDLLRQEILSDRIFRHDDTLPADDHTLTRFLRARSFHVAPAKAMLSDCLHWRRTVEDVGIMNLYRTIDPFDFPERHYVFEHWPMYFHKTDKYGRPVNIQSLGAANLPTLYKRVSHARLWQTLLVNSEALFAEVFPAASATAGRHIDQALVIIDLKGFSLHQFWQMKSLARRCLEISQTQFPETMGQLVLINAPASFTVIWAGIKPLLSPESSHKVSILCADYADTLRALIPTENLPKALGGKCTCADRGGCAFSNAGPWMEGRKERRGKWLKGELERPGVPSTWGGLDNVDDALTDMTNRRQDPEKAGESATHGSRDAGPSEPLDEKRAEPGIGVGTSPSHSPTLPISVPGLGGMRDLTPVMVA